MTQTAPPDVMLHPWTAQSIGFELRNIGGSSGPPASSAWPTANRVCYIPFWLLRSDTVQRFWWINGATLGANVDVAVYRDAAGLPTTKILGTGSTAQSGTNVIQSVTPSSTLRMDAGNYWMAMSMSLNTGTVFAAAPPQMGHVVGSNVVCETTGVFGLPATATPISPNMAFVPMFGIAFRTLV